MHGHDTLKASRLLRALALGVAMLAAAPAQAFDGGCCCDDGRYDSVGFGAAGTGGGLGLGAGLGGLSALGGGLGGSGVGYGGGYGGPGYGAGYGGPAYAPDGGYDAGQVGYGTADGYGRGIVGVTRRRSHGGIRRIGFAAHRGATLRRFD